MVHVVDADEELMFAFDHNPPMPTTQWKPGQTVEYTRTVFVPIYPYVGEATIQVGLYSTATQKRAAAGGRGCRAARLQGREAPAAAADRERVHGLQGRAGTRPKSPSTTRRSSGSGRRRTRRCRSRIPKKDCVFYLDVDNPGSVFNEAAAGQGDAGRPTCVDEFTLQPKQPELRKIPLKAAQLGGGRRGGARHFGRQDVRAGGACRRQQGSARAGCPRLSRVRRSQVR